MVGATCSVAASLAVPDADVIQDADTMTMAVAGFGLSSFYQ